MLQFKRISRAIFKTLCVKTSAWLYYSHINQIQTWKWKSIQWYS